MGRSSQTLQLQTLRRLPIFQIPAMSRYTCSTLLVVVVIALIPDQTVSLPNPQPSISFQRLGKQKDNLIRAAGGIKQELFSPLIGIKRGLIEAKRGIVAPLLNLKTGLIKTKLGLVSGIVGAKANIARGFLRPVFGIKRAKLQALRGLIDSKINLLDGF